MTLHALTRRQGAIVSAVHRLTVGGVAPSYKELCQELGLKSMSAISRLLFGAEERGWLYRLPYKARAVWLTAEARAFVGPQAGDLCPACPYRRARILAL